MPKCMTSYERDTPDNVWHIAAFKMNCLIVAHYTVTRLVSLLSRAINSRWDENAVSARTSLIVIGQFFVDRYSPNGYVIKRYKFHETVYSLQKL